MGWQPGWQSRLRPATWAAPALVLIVALAAVVALGCASGPASTTSVSSASAGQPGTPGATAESTTTTPSTTEAVVTSTTATTAPVAATTAPTTPSSTTSVTMPAGYITFEQIAANLEELVSDRALAGTFPLQPLQTADVSWLWAGAKTFTVSDSRGYRTPDGDVIVIFNLSETAAAETKTRNPYSELTAAATARYRSTGKEVWAFPNGTYGYVVASTHYMRELGMLAQRAVITLPIPEPWYGRALATVATNFEAWLQSKQGRKVIPGALPSTKLAAEDLAWLTEQPCVTAATGYRLANGDVAIPFYVRPFSSYGAQQSAQNAIEKAAKAWYRKSSTRVAVWMEGDYGYVVAAASRQERAELRGFLDNARWGNGPDI
jgi:hypothetical protein